jgi:AcrR family transcriptional regulator
MQGDGGWDKDKRRPDFASGAALAMIKMTAAVLYALCINDGGAFGSDGQPGAPGAASLHIDLPVNRAQQRDRKATQLPRIRSAMIEVAAAHGYTRASIARVIDRAGVSRPTFYDYFAGREECMLAVIELAREELLGRARETVAVATGRDAFAGVVDALVSFAQDQPALARVLYGEAMSAGPRALQARDRVVVELEALLEDAYAPLNAATPMPDVPGAIVIGAIFRLLGHRLRRCEPQLDQAGHELLEWIRAYERCKREHRWRVLARSGERIGPHSSAGVVYLPAALGVAAAGADRSSGTPAPAERRRRILLSLAELCAEEGYAAVSVEDMTRRAGVEMRTFYRIFAGKQEAFAALAEMYFQHTMALAAGAFFSDRGWPERVLRAKLALAGCVEANPAMAQACFVEGHAGECAGGERVEQLTRAFMLFLSEGQQQRQGQAGASRLGQEAIAHANFELVYRQARASKQPRMAAVLGHSLHLCLAPFVGVGAAEQLVARELAEQADSNQAPGSRSAVRPPRDVRRTKPKRRVGETHLRGSVR